MLYAIGDLHLSLGTDKPMDVFGDAWKNHINRIKYGFSSLTEDDTCVICGDISWGMTNEECLPDFKFIDSLPGKKIILKGNHDFWWSTQTKINKFFEENGISSIKILHNNFFPVGDLAVCGTRGWFYEEEQKGGEHDKKIMLREVGRLETSLKAADGYEKKYCFLHYPPVYGDYICHEITELLNDYGVTKCFFGHIHGFGIKAATQGYRDGTDFRLVSADYLGFTPIRVI